MLWTVVLLVAYLLGSIPFGYLLVRFFRKEDIRATGSGNIGATNVVRSGAKGLGVATLVLDLLKALFAVEIAKHFAPAGGNLAIAAGVVAVLGHIFPVWLGFRGGKGVASALGVFSRAFATHSSRRTHRVSGARLHHPLHFSGIDPRCGVRTVLRMAFFARLEFSDWACNHLACCNHQAPQQPSPSYTRHGKQVRQQEREGGRMSRIGVIGAGSWGTALALSLARRGGHDICMWAHSPSHAEELSDVGENLRYLPGFKLPENVQVTSKLSSAIDAAKIVLCVTPSQNLREVVKEIAPALRPEQILLSASKGIEEKTFLRMSQVMEALCDNPIGTLGGPSFAQEVAAAMPTAITIAIPDPQIASCCRMSSVRHRCVSIGMRMSSEQNSVER